MGKRKNHDYDLDETDEVVEGTLMAYFEQVAKDHPQTEDERKRKLASVGLVDIRDVVNQRFDDLKKVVDFDNPVSGTFEINSWEFGKTLEMVLILVGTETGVPKYKAFAAESNGQEREFTMPDFVVFKHRDDEELFKLELAAAGFLGMACLAYGKRALFKELQSRKAIEAKKANFRTWYGKYADVIWDLKVREYGWGHVAKPLSRILASCINIKDMADATEYRRYCMTHNKEKFLFGAQLTPEQWDLIKQACAACEASGL